jgi:peroxiredoxin
VAWYGDDGSFSAFVQKYGLTFPQISDDGGVIFERFGVVAQPATAIVRTDGSVVLQPGVFDEAAMTAALAADGA